MNIKKVLTAGLLSLAVLACGKKEENKPAEKLTGTISVQVEESWKPYYEAAVARLKEKNPDANVELKVVASFDHLDVLDKTDASNVDVADVFAMPLDRLEGLAEKEVLASFDAKALGDQIGGFGDYDSNLGGLLKKGDTYLGFPFNIETLVLGLNTKNAAANNIDLNQTVDFAKLPANVAMLPVFNAWWGVAVTNAFGVELLGKDGDKFFSDLTKDFSELTPEQQQMFEGLFNYWKSANSSKSPIFDVNAVYGFMDDQFKTGKTGSARVIGPWEVGSVTELIGSDFDVMGLNHASWQGKELKHWKGGWALAINSRNEEDTQKMELAKAFIAELMNPQFAGDFYKITGKIMPNVSKEDYAKTDLSDLDKKVIMSVIEGYEGAVSRPLFKEWGQVWDTWQNSLISWNAKKPATVEDAYKEVQASFKALLTNLGQ